jgi:hypothetical protein
MGSRLLTENAILRCDHGGSVSLAPTQSWVTIERRRILVATNPENRSIGGCTNNNPPLGLKPCLNTLAVTHGYSEFVRVDGRRVCLESVTGNTDGTPPAAVHYSVKNPAQSLVASSA